MKSTNSTRGSFKQKAVHELMEFLVIFLYLAFFFCALSTYSMLVLNELHVRYLSYAFALINALLISKVIMIGEYVGVGRHYEARPLLLSALYKAVLFGALVLAFHMLEEIIKHRIHGESVSTALHAVRVDELMGRVVIVVCTFVPLFAFRELRRLLGEERFNALVFRSEKRRSNIVT